MKRIRNKLVLTMMVLTLLPALLIGAYSLYTTSEALQDNVLSEQRNQLSQIQHDIEGHVSGVERDLLFLRDSSAMQLYLAAKQTSQQRSRLLLKNLENSALLFAQQQKIYSAVRLLDKQGNEVLRIEKQGVEAKRLSNKELLKHQKDREFFKNTVMLVRGQIYISPLQLRRENGRVLTPHQATIRYATIVSDKDGNTQGVLVLNLDAERIIEKAIKEKKLSWDTFFTDPDGYFYYHPDKSKRWGSPADVGHEHNAFHDKSLPLASLKDSQEAALIESKQDVILSQPVSLGVQRPSLGYLFSIAPKNILFKPLRDYFTISLIIVGISLLLSLVFAMMLANSLSAPVVALKKQVEKFSQGDLDTPIKVNAKNEIGELSHAIELLRKSMNILMKRSRKA